MIKDYIQNPYRVFMLLGDRGLLDWLPDEPAVRLFYRANMGERLNLDQPKTFCEKLNWLKIYDRQEKYTQYADKLGVRDYVAQTIGGEYLVPLLGVWDDPEEIDFDALPDRFVLKATHDSGSVLVCRDKATLHREAATQYFKKALRNRFYMKGRERQYEHVIPRVLAEEYLDSGTDAPPMDYKIYCFGGKARLIMVATDRGTKDGVKMTYFDTEWERMPTWCKGVPIDNRTIAKPACLEDMLRFAEALSNDTPQMRVDFYVMQEHIYFGEMTLCDGSGVYPFAPPEWERRIGDWITLPEEGIRRRAQEKASCKKRNH